METRNKKAKVDSVDEQTSPVLNRLPDTRSSEMEGIDSLLDSTENSPMPSPQMVDHPQENEDNTSNDDSVVCLDDSDDEELGRYSPVSVEKMEELKKKHSKQNNNEVKMENDDNQNDVIYEKGDKIKVWWKEQSYDAKIIAVKSEGTEQPKYKVHYTGYNNRHNKWIEKSEIIQQQFWDEGRTLRSRRLTSAGVQTRDGKSMESGSSSTTAVSSQQSVVKNGCDQCEKTYTYKSCLEKHKKMHKNNIEIQTIEPRFVSVGVQIGESGASTPPRSDYSDSSTPQLLPITSTRPTPTMPELEENSSNRTPTSAEPIGGFSDSSEFQSGVSIPVPAPSPDDSDSSTPAPIPISTTTQPTPELEENSSSGDFSDTIDFQEENFDGGAEGGMLVQQGDQLEQPSPAQTAVCVSVIRSTRQERLRAAADAANSYVSSAAGSGIASSSSYQFTQLQPTSVVSVNKSVLCIRIPDSEDEDEDIEQEILKNEVTSDEDHTSSIWRPYM